MKFLFLMNPLDTVVMVKDTSFAFMLGAHKAGHDVYYLPLKGITQTQGHFSFNVQKVIPQCVESNPFIVEEYLTLNESEVDAIFIRTDPPFDYDYLMKTWLLDHVTDKIFVMNDPAGIRTVNEKIWATQFTDLIPPTCVTRNKEEYKQFLAAHQHIVAKPTDGFGGQSVFQVKPGDPNTNVIFETLTDNGKCDVILQRYLPEATAGDKRILLLNGEILGAVLRLHGADDHRNNFFSGGKPVKTEITERERHIVEVLKPYLLQLGLYFVGIDIMGDYLIEVNVTSPTCIQEINRLSGVHLEDAVIRFVESKVEYLKTTGTIKH